jgi:glycosyltransferase involved in cell wall biosynthesis
MKFSVLINNYNYAAYLQECVDSVLAQTRLPDEIVVVDDGSSDNSLTILDRQYGHNSLVKVVATRNLGQTAAIAAGIEHASGDILCLLDADDRFKSNYLAELEAHYERNPHVDLTFCRFEVVGMPTPLSNDDNVWLAPQADYDYGYTALLTYFGNLHWIGNLTSSLSLRAKLARALHLREAANVFSYIYAAGEYPLLIGTSLLCGRKYYLHKDLVEHRRHERNDSISWNINRNLHYRKIFNEYIWADYYKKLSSITDSMKWQLKAEAATVPAPLDEHLKAYKKAYLLSLAPRFLIDLMKHFVKLGRERLRPE